MAAPWHLIEEKLEDAFAAALLTEYGGTVDSAGLVSGGSLAGWYLFKGFSLLEIVPPYICVKAVSSEPSEPNVETPTGNQTVQLMVSVHGQKNEDTRSAHSAMAARVKDFCYASNLVALLTAETISDLTIRRTFPGMTERTVEDDYLVTSTELRVLAYPS